MDLNQPISLEDQGFTEYRFIHGVKYEISPSYITPVCPKPHVCLICTRELPPCLVSRSVSWVSILRVVFYSLKKLYPEKEYFNLKKDVYGYVAAHWDVICTKKKRTPGWRKQLQDALSHCRRLFESGADHHDCYGFWKLKDHTDPWEENLDHFSNPSSPILPNNHQQQQQQQSHISSYPSPLLSGDSAQFSGSPSPMFFSKSNTPILSSQLNLRSSNGSKSTSPNYNNYICDLSNLGLSSPHQRPRSKSLSSGSSSSSLSSSFHLDHPHIIPFPQSPLQKQHQQHHNHQHHSNNHQQFQLNSSTGSGGAFHPVPRSPFSMNSSRYDKTPRRSSASDDLIDVMSFGPIPKDDNFKLSGSSSPLNTTPTTSSPPAQLSPPSSSYSPPQKLNSSPPSSNAYHNKASISNLINPIMEEKDECSPTLSSSSSSISSGSLTSISNINKSTIEMPSLPIVTRSHRSSSSPINFISYRSSNNNNNNNNNKSTTSPNLLESSTNSSASSILNITNLSDSSNTLPRISSFNYKFYPNEQSPSLSPDSNAHDVFFKNNRKRTKDSVYFTFKPSLEGGSNDTSNCTRYFLREVNSKNNINIEVNNLIFSNRDSQSLVLNTDPKNIMLSGSFTPTEDGHTNFHIDHSYLLLDVPTRALTNGKFYFVDILKNQSSQYVAHTVNNDSNSFEFMKLDIGDFWTINLIDMDWVEKQIFTEFPYKAIVYGTTLYKELEIHYAFVNINGAPTKCPEIPPVNCLKDTVPTYSRNADRCYKNTYIQ
ncbi:histidine kinase [Heterostelium album PN500]|uniref:Histidine kinase n=1 Tax=Heterostelium pallidum (strain ATCC 26659 / Pp 5 / PN500) TaxID=670386 RepID=D3BRM4_HETP5|nr:histidine kinase [Heterostelium album PN500]EFA76056.1 histidine kinase [Heterostelium album PN500]|eukprot:XP_020428190.1 histidine kinase [Heterostelium album PN500]